MRSRGTFTCVDTPATYSVCSFAVQPDQTRPTSESDTREAMLRFEKRMKESARKAKKDAKRNERLQRKSDARADNPDGDEPAEQDGEDTGEPEPDSQ